MIFLNNSQYLEVKDVKIKGQKVDDEQVFIEAFLYDGDELVDSFVFEHVGDGIHQADIPSDLAIENGVVYGLKTNVVYNNVQGSWEDSVRATIRRPQKRAT